MICDHTGRSEILETNCKGMQLTQHIRSLQPKGDPPTPRGTWGNFGETRGGVGKMAFWRTKAAISIKFVNMEEKLLWRAYRKQRSFERYHPRLRIASHSSRSGVCNSATPLILGTGKATDFKFGGYIYRANPNKSSFKILEKTERGRIQGLAKFFGCPLLSQEQIKLYGLQIL